MNTGWIALFSFAAIATVAVIARLAVQTWVKTLVEKSVSTKFEKELEAVRSDLRMKEGKISALQATALSGRAGRQSILDKRCIEAIENLWREVLNLDVFLWPARMVQILKIEVVDELARDDPKVRQFVDAVRGGDLDEKMKDMGGEAERPLLPPQVWKVFSAYRSLLVYCYARMKVASIGGGGEDMFKDEDMIDEIKAVMPHFTQYLDKFGVAGAAGLTGPLRELVFEGLRSALSSHDADVENVAGSSAVMELIAGLDRKMVKRVE